MSVKEVNLQFDEENHVKLYSLYRPNPPEEILEIIMEYLREKYDGELTLSVDAGCGSGQSSIILSKLFRRVVALDASESQIKEAIKARSADNIEYRVQAAEVLPVPDASTQLVTASTALHWFHLDSFFKEVRRILVPGGVLAAYTYHKILPLTGDPKKDEELCRCMQEIYEVHLKSYFAQENELCFKEYEDIHFPFESVKRLLGVRQTYPGTLKDVFGFFTTLSAFHNLRNEQGEEVAEKVYRDVRARFCNILQVDEAEAPENVPLTLYRDYTIILCRNEGTANSSI